jgi:copper transport protein
VAFPVAVLSGLFLAWRVVPGWDAFLDTTYGRLLVGKIALVGLAGTLAFWNRQRVVPSLRQADGAGRVLLGRLLAVEIGALVLVIALTASLTGRPPESDPMAADDVGAPFLTDRFLEQYHVVVAVEPGTAGPNKLALDFHRLDTATVDPESVEATFAFGESRGGPISYSLEHVDGPRWETGVDLLQAGDWTMTIVATLAGGGTEELELTVPVGR